MKNNCASCGAEKNGVYLKNTSIGDLCDSCYNDYLAYFVEEAKGGIRKSFFIFFLTNIFFLILFLTGTLVADEISDGMSILAFYALIFGVIGGVNLVKSGFQPVGKAQLRNHLYEGEVDSYGNVNVRSKGSYDTYTTEQWMTIAMNVIVFALGVAITLGAGSIVFLVNVLSYNSKKKEYAAMLEKSGVDSKTHTNPIKILKKYKGPLSQKCINFENDYYTKFKGVEMEHIGYLIHEDELYGAIGTKDESQSEFTAGTAYFIKLSQKNDKFEYVDNPSELYSTLYTKLWGEEDQPSDTPSTKNISLQEYRSELSKKVMNIDTSSNSFIHGEEVSHVGYLIHENELYGVISTDNEDQDEFQPNCLYFIRVNKNSEDYEVVEIDLALYQTLYDRFDEIRK